MASANCPHCSKPLDLACYRCFKRATRIEGTALSGYDLPFCDECYAEHRRLVAEVNAEWVRELAEMREEMKSRG